MNMIQNAKDLISKGKQLGDNELIQMGMDLLNQQVPTSVYICQNCGHEIEADKTRKRCPKCKKHKLELVEPQSAPQEEFLTQIRPQQSSRQIVFQNTWSDDRTEGFDEEDAELKKITKPAPRMRPPAQQVEVKCTNCGRSEKIHPLHAPTGDTRSFYMCARCIRNRRSF